MLKLSPALVPAIHMLNSTALFLVPAITMGIGFPLALQAWSNYQHKVGQTTGIVYGINTIGAVLGGLVTGFLIIPALGVQLSITVLGLIGLWLGVMMVQLFSGEAKLRSRLIYVSVGVGLTIAPALIPSGLFKHLFVSFGNRKLSRIVSAKEGVNATVSVHEDVLKGLGERLMAVDGIVIAGDERNIRSAQKTLGHLGLLLNKNAKEVLSIGFGSGETTACLSRHNLDRIDCVEIAPEVVEVGLQFFEHINLGKSLDKKVNMMYLDAKNYLHLTTRRYDIIINGADKPTNPGSAAMFTREHFRNALEHLESGGLFITKLHMQGSKSSFDSVLGTFLDVYRHVTIWFPTTKPYVFFYLVGSSEPQLFSPKHIDEQLRKESVRDSAAYMNFHSNLDVLSCYIGDQDDIRKYVKSFHINSDHRPYVEFNSHQKRQTVRELFSQFTEVVRSGSVIRHIDWTGMSQDEQDKWRSDHSLVYKVSDYILRAHGQDADLLRLRTISEGLKFMPGNPALLDQQDESLSLVRNFLDKGLLDADKLIAEANKTIKNYPDFGAAWLIKSWALQHKNQMAVALTSAERAANYAQHTALAYDNLGLIYLQLGQTDKALEYFSRAIKLRPNDARLHLNLGIALTQQKKVDQAIGAYRKALSISPNYHTAQNRLNALLETEHLRQDSRQDIGSSIESGPQQ